MLALPFCLLFSILSSCLARIFRIEGKTREIRVQVPLGDMASLYIYPGFNIGGFVTLDRGVPIEHVCTLQGAGEKGRVCKAAHGVELSKGAGKPQHKDATTNVSNHVVIHVNRMNCAVIGKYRLTVFSLSGSTPTVYTVPFAIGPGVLEKKVDARPSSLKLTCFVNVGTNGSHTMSWSMYPKDGVKRTLRGRSVLKENKKQPCIEVLESIATLGSESDTDAKVVCRYGNKEEQQERTFNLLQHAKLSDEGARSFMGIPQNHKHFVAYVVTLVVSLCVSALAIIWVCMYCWLRQRNLYSVSDCETCTASTCDQCESDCSDENCDYMLPEGATLRGILCHKHRAQEASRGTEYSVGESSSSDDLGMVKASASPVVAPKDGKGKDGIKSKYLRAVRKAREQVSKSAKKSSGKPLKPKRPKRKKKKRKKRKRDKKKRRRLRTHAKTAHRRAKHLAKKRLGKSGSKVKRSKSRTSVPKKVVRASPAGSKPDQSRSGALKPERRTDSSRGTREEKKESTEVVQRPSLAVPVRVLERIRATIMVKEKEEERIAEGRKERGSKETSSGAKKGSITGADIEKDWNQPIKNPYSMRF